MSVKATFIKTSNEVQFGSAIADYFSDILKNNNEPSVILPTGFTPLPFYKEVVSRYKDGDKHLGKFKYLALDEYLGLEQGDKRSFATWLGREILNPLNIQDRIIFNSATKDTEKECSNIEKVINNNGAIDLAIIGIGTNGHIGFNEPGSSLDSRARKITLTQETREANSEYWGNIEEVPTHALTLGIGTLKKAHKTLLIVQGKRKAKILRETLYEEISSSIPSTYLQEQENLTIIGDKEAFSELPSGINYL